MKINVLDLTRGLDVDVRGDEAWLKDIYDLYADSSASAPSLLRAKIEIAAPQYGLVDVKGSFQYAPHVPCDRCGDSLEIPLSDSFELRYRSEPTTTSQSKDVDLLREELDQYFLQDGKLNLIELLNDQVNAALPNLVHCGRVECESNLARMARDDGSPTTPRAPNPFAVLSQLKDLN